MSGLGKTASSFMFGAQTPRGHYLENQKGDSKSIHKDPFLNMNHTAATGATTPTGLRKGVGSGATTPLNAPNQNSAFYSHNDSTAQSFNGTDVHTIEPNSPTKTKKNRRQNNKIKTLQQVYTDQTQSVQHQDKSSPLLRTQTLAADHHAPEDRNLKAKKKIAKRVSTVDAAETRDKVLSNKSDE